jgi:hypothetical protein
MQPVQFEITGLCTEVAMLNFAHITSTPSSPNPVPLNEDSVVMSWKVEMLL